jgi:Cu+-exporting ATPase
MIVKPGEKIPLDGIITQGSARIDEAMITGEPLPVSKTIDDQVIGATIVSDSTLYIKATALGQDTYLSKIIAIVDQAQNSKPEIQQLADKIMKYFSRILAIVWEKFLS